MDISAYGSLADISQCNRHVLFTPEKTLAGGEYAVRFVPDVDSGFLDAKHI